MAQRVFVRVSCDSHQELFKSEREVERGIDEDPDGRPPFYHEFTWDGAKRIVYCCDDCVHQLLGLMLVFAESKGAEPPSKRIGRPPVPRTVLPPAPREIVETHTSHDEPEPDESEVIDEPKVPEAPEVPEVIAVPNMLRPVCGVTQDLLLPDDDASNVVPLSASPRFPCMFCQDVAYGTPGAVRAHLNSAHGVNADVLLGTRCHACGDELGTPKGLGAHFGVRHIRQNHGFGRSLMESLIWARDHDDPHGTVAAAIERIGTYRQASMR